MKFKPQQCYKLIKTLLQTENEGRLGFELWPRFADFARFFCAFALKSYFSRAAAKLRQSESCDDADECDVQAVEEEDAYSFVRTHIIQECQLVHPIMYDTYNLCEMCEQRKLTKLSVSMLRLICCYFDLKCESVSLKRKAPYVKLIEDLVKSCSCN